MTYTSSVAECRDSVGLCGLSKAVYACAILTGPAYIVVDVGNLHLFAANIQFRRAFGMDCSERTGLCAFSASIADMSLKQGGGGDLCIGKDHMKSLTRSELGR